MGVQNKLLQQKGVLKAAFSQFQTATNLTMRLLDVMHETMKVLFLDNSTWYKNLSFQCFD